MFLALKKNIYTVYIVKIIFFLTTMIYIYAVSDSNKHFSHAIEEYIKRLWKQLSIQYIKPSKKWNKAECIAQESKTLLEKIEKVNGYTVLLHIDSQSLDTLKFHELIESKMTRHANIIFIIWWAYGTGDEVSHRVDMRCSFSPMTFPHSMALLILVEQIYRSYTLKSGKAYHH